VSPGIRARVRAAVRVAEAAHALRDHDETCRDSVFLLRDRCYAHDRDGLEAELDSALFVWRAGRKPGVKSPPGAA